MSNRNNVHIEDSAVVSERAAIGEGTNIWHFAQVRENASIGRNCNIGKGVYIDFDVNIGDNVKIQNLVSVYHGVIIEDDVFVGPHVVFTNDMYPRSFSGESWKVYPTTIEKGASLGANSTIICGNSVGEYAMVGAGSVVTEDVPCHALVVGNPARIIHAVCMCGQPLNDDDVVAGVDICHTCGRKNDIPDEVRDAIRLRKNGGFGRNRR